VVEVFAIREPLGAPTVCVGIEDGKVYVVIDDARWDERDGIVAAFQLALSGDMPTP